MSSRTLTNRTRPKPCLLCYREYFDNSIGLKNEANQSRLSTESSGSDNHQVFTLFCKILEMDETAYSSAWDFENETLPFCASCASLAIRLSRLYDEMAVIQQEIILSTEIIKGTLEKSQDCLNGERVGQSDQRIDAFRNHVFRENTKTVSPPIHKRANNSMLKRNQDYDVIDNQKVSMESKNQSGDSRNTLVFHRQSIDEDDNDDNHMDASMSPGRDSVGERDQGYSLGFYTEREYNNNNNNNNNNNQSYRNNNKGNGWEKNKRAVFVHDDIEVYEVEGARNEGYGMLSRVSKNSSNPEQNQTNILESQLRIQRSYNHHFNNSDPEPNSVHFMTPQISSVAPSTRQQRQYLPSKLPNQLIRIRDGNHQTLLKPQHGVTSNRTHSNGSHIQATPHSQLYKRAPSTTVNSNLQYKIQQQQQQLEPTEGIHACQLCSKTYTKPYQLKAHLRLHTGEKPYRCSICFKTFRLAGNLRVHVRIHTGETPYECNYCGKRCTQKSQLNTHVLIHHDANGKRKK